MKKMTAFSDMIGKTLLAINNTGDEIVFTLEDESTARLYHDQDCCESVSVEDVVGELDWLVGSPILTASEESNSDNPKEGTHANDCFTWTFYRISTAKGMVVVRFYGESNGYYSESVSFKHA